MGERQQLDHGPAGDARSPALEQALPGSAVGRAREQRVTVDEMQQRHRLAAQAVNDMPVVHHLDAASVARRTAARQGQHQALADEAFQPVIVDAQVQPIADQARRHRVEHLAQDEAAAGGHPHAGLVMIGGAPRRQPAQFGALQGDQLLAPGVAAADQVGDPVAIGSRLSKSVLPRSSRAWATARLRWPCWLSIAPFSWATPRLLRVGCMP